MYSGKFPIICVFQILYKWKTGDQLKIHFVHLLADKNKHIDSYLSWFQVRKDKHMNLKTFTDMIR